MYTHIILILCIHRDIYILYIYDIYICVCIIRISYIILYIYIYYSKYIYMYDVTLVLFSLMWFGKLMNSGSLGSHGFETWRSRFHFERKLIKTYPESIALVVQKKNSKKVVSQSLSPTTSAWIWPLCSTKEPPAHKMTQTMKMSQTYTVWSPKVTLSHTIEYLCNQRQCTEGS